MELHKKIVEIAPERWRFGYRRIHDLLRPQFPGVNQKRVHRLYRQANLAVRRRKMGKRPACRIPRLPGLPSNEGWGRVTLSACPARSPWRCWSPFDGGQP
jgi:putative transposase